MPEINNTFWRHNWPALTWALVILILCGIPGTTLPELTFLEWLKPDKIAHLVLFGIQSFLLLKGFTKQKIHPSLNKNAVIYALTLSIAYGAIVELMQDYVFIHRSGDIRDVFANALGALIGYWFYKRYNRRTAFESGIK